MPRGASGRLCHVRQSRLSGRRQLVRFDTRSGSLPSHPESNQLFAKIIRYALAPVVLLLSGFFTANFLIVGQYTWPRTSRILALTLTLVVLSYEFVFKELRTQRDTPELARAGLLYSCVIPYVIGMVIMLLLWKL